MVLREYIVTLYKYEDLDSFYEDMETPGGNLYIPSRAVELLLRRKNSRKNHELKKKSIIKEKDWKKKINLNYFLQKKRCLKKVY